MAGGTSRDTIGFGVTLGGGNLSGSVTMTALGEVMSSPGTGLIGVSSAAPIVNEGLITGSAGGAYYLRFAQSGVYATAGFAGGNGVQLTGESLINHGTIIGGQGGAGSPGFLFHFQYVAATPGGPGGNGVYVVSGAVTNFGTILGGNDGTGAPSANNPGSVDAMGIRLVGPNATLINAGFIGGGTTRYGTANAVYFRYPGARLILEPGASFHGAVVAPGNGNVVELAIGNGPGSIAGLGDTLKGFDALQFDPGAAWLIAGSGTGLADGMPIDGFAASDTIELTGFVATGFSYTGSGLVLSGPSGSQTIGIQGTFAVSDFNVVNDGTNTFVEMAPPCFTAGTRIGTERGEIAVEAMRVGDRVTVAGDAPAPVIWIGHRTMDCARHPDPREVWPVRIAAGAFGPDKPRRDLLLSPDHAVFADEVLIPVKYLVNGASIVQVPMDAVTYYHVELPRHAVLLAENLPAESYLDTGDRARFANGGNRVSRFPNFASRTREAAGCAPLIVTGPKLAAVHARVRAIAATLTPIAAPAMIAA